MTISAVASGGRGEIDGEIFWGSSGDGMFSDNNVSPVSCSIITLSINSGMCCMFFLLSPSPLSNDENSCCIFCDTLTWKVATTKIKLFVVGLPYSFTLDTAEMGGSFYNQLFSIKHPSICFPCMYLQSFKIWWIDSAYSTYGWPKGWRGGGEGGGHWWYIRVQTQIQD